MIPQDVRFGELSFGELPPPDAEIAVADEFPAMAEAAPDGLDTEIDDEEQPAPEVIGGESDTFEGNGAEEARQRRASRMLRNYRIQEVIRRRQIILVQVVKEERGSKGAALTTYISLAGRFCVLMPNSPRGGGISRKITSGADRRRLKEITAELEIPKGMGLIVRTAGAARPKPEIKRDCEYLMRLWDDIRDHTLRSMAPALIYEEASLIKRAIRDVYSRDVDEILVDGEAGWRAAHEFMRMLMPSHAKKVQLWRGAGQPLFAKNNVEEQLDSMLAPTVQLKSGGYLVINQTEALVAIDVNSGRSTRERGIEETALKTNLEASDEVARQLRLRDLAGLIVIDYIDMEARKHNAMVERRLKDALKNDRARIQVGQISHFGLMEMSRQRLRPSLAETSFVMCPHCGGQGHVRSIESSAVHVLREIEDEGAKERAAHIMVHVANAVAMFILNNKRQRLLDIEARYAMQVHFSADESLTPPAVRIDRLRPQVPAAERVVPAVALAGPVMPAAPLHSDEMETDAEDIVSYDDDEEEAPDVEMQAARSSPAVDAGATQGAGSDDASRRKRRRRRRGGRREPGETDAEAAAADREADDEEAVAVAVSTEHVPPAPVTEPAEGQLAGDGAEANTGEQPSLDPADLDENGLPKARRRGRRGGRRRRRDAPGDAPTDTPGQEGKGAEAGNAPVDAMFEPSDQTAPVYVAPVYVAPVYSGPTPADPFGNQPFDIFDMMDMDSEQAPPPPRRAAPVPMPAPAPVPKAQTGQLPLDIPPVPVAAVEPVAVEPVAVEPEAVEPGAEPVQEVAAAPAPVAQPTIVGAEDAPVPAPKRGWWRKLPAFFSLSPCGIGPG